MLAILVFNCIDYNKDCPEWILKDNDKTHGLCVITHRANWAIIAMVLDRRILRPGLGWKRSLKIQPLTRPLAVQNALR